jgi:hypothetical protein
MKPYQFCPSLAFQNDNKILASLVDGLGGMSHNAYGCKNGLEYATIMIASIPRKLSGC